LIHKILDNITRIIQGCIDKDYKYQKIVYEHYRGYSLKIIFRYIYRYEKAIDVMNDGFVKLFNNFHKFKPDAGEDNEKLMMGYIRRIMINISIDELRRGNMLPEIGGIPDHVWDIPAKRDNADQLLLYKDLIIMVRTLPPQYRMIFNLHVIDGYSHIEIAEMLNIPVGASKSGLSRARSILQANLKQMESAIV
jgi:RNA polymerase sigma factor (sigma-70 family)